MNSNLATVALNTITAKPCLASFDEFLASFVPFARTGRLHLVVAGQEPITNEEGRYGADFYPGKTDLTYRSTPIRWVDDVSYGRHQADDDCGDYNDYLAGLPSERCCFDVNSALVAIGGSCAVVAHESNIPF